MTFTMVESSKLDLYDLLILILAASENCTNIKGRTTLQKLGYFIVNKLNIDNDYIHHYYGPFSPMLTMCLSRLISLKLINEEYSLTENDRGLYVYSLTERGKKYCEELINNNKESFNTIKKIVENLKKIKGDIIEALSFAAKIHYIENKAKTNLDEYYLPQMAKKYGWNMNDKDLIKSSRELLNLI
jgi:uncharacterized protein YwgA